MQYGFNAARNFVIVGAVAAAAGLGGCSGKVPLDDKSPFASTAGGPLSSIEEIATLNPSSPESNGVLVVRNTGDALLVVPAENGDVAYAAKINPAQLAAAVEATENRGITGRFVNLPVTYAVVADPAVKQLFMAETDLAGQTFKALPDDQKPGYKAQNIILFTVDGRSLQPLTNKTADGKPAFVIMVANPTPVSGENAQAVFKRLYVDPAMKPADPAKTSAITPANAAIFAYVRNRGQRVA